MDIALATIRAKSGDTPADESIVGVGPVTMACTMLRKTPASNGSFPHTHLRRRRTRQPHTTQTDASADTRAVLRCFEAAPKTDRDTYAVTPHPATPPASRTGT